MPIDTSIYGNLKQHEMPSIADSAHKAMTLSHLAKQNQAADMEMAQKAQKQKMTAIGTALEGLAPLPEEKRAQAYAQVRAKLIQDGLAKPEDAPEQYDPGLYRQTLMAWRQSDVGQSWRKNEADIAKLQAEAAEKARERTTGKLIPAGEASKIGNFLGAVDASQKIETLGGTVPTGKWEAFKDWGKSLLDIQDQDRAKNLADIANQRNEVMSKIAGANVTADEKARVLEGIPTNTDAGESFTGKGRSTTDQLLGKAEAEITALADAGYDVRELRARLHKRKAELALIRKDEDARQKRKLEAGGVIPSAVADERSQAPSKPKTVRQGGHTYTLNEKTGEYE